MSETNAHALSEEDLKFNEKLLLGYFLYTTFNGALRKWVFSGSSGIGTVLLFLQIASPVLLTYFMRRKKRGLFYFPILPLSITLMVLAFNPLSHTMYHSFFGFVIHIGFWLLMLIYVQERDSYPIEKILGPIAVCCVIEYLLGFMQFGLPTDHFINRYVSDNNDVAGVGDTGTRIVGTFSYITGYAGFLIFSGLFLWGLMVENKRNLMVIYSLFALGLLAAFMNGGRAVVLPFILAVTFGFLHFGSIGNKLKAVAVAFLLVIAALVGDVGTKLPIISEAFEAFYGRVRFGQESGDTAGRTMMTFNEISDNPVEYPLFGIGLGASYQGAISKWGGSPLLPPFEAEPGRVIIEGGYFLFLIRTLLLIFLISKLRIPLYFSVPILLYIFLFLPVIFSPAQCTYIFFALMVVDKIYYLKQKEAALLEQP